MNLGSGESNLKADDCFDWGDRVSAQECEVESRRADEAHEASGRTAEQSDSKFWMGDFRGRAEARRRAGDKSERRGGFMHAVPTHHFFNVGRLAGHFSCCSHCSWTEGHRLSA